MGLSGSAYKQGIHTDNCRYPHLRCLCNPANSHEPPYRTLIEALIETVIGNLVGTLIATLIEPSLTY